MMSLATPGFSSAWDPGSIWTCPHTFLSATEARKMLLYRPPDASEAYEERLPPCPQCASHLSVTLQHKFPQGEHRITLRTDITLWQVQNYSCPVSATKSFSRDRIALALAPLDLPLCQHVRIKHSTVAGCRRCNCLQLQMLNGEDVPCACWESLLPSHESYIPHGQHFGACRVCWRAGTMTQAGFQAREMETNGTKMLNLALVIFRDIGALKWHSETSWAA